MKFNLINAKLSDLEIALGLLKSAAETLARKNISQWDYWMNPPKEKIIWIKEGFKRKEFYLIESSCGELIGMVRIMNKDIVYWGKMNDKAIYIHSLIIKEQFKGNKIGRNVIQLIKENSKNKEIDLIRLDCDNNNKKLCYYYENIGFQKVGEKQLALGKYNLYEKYL